MLSRLRNLTRHRAVKILIEIGLILLVYLVLKAWLQRNMIEGTPPAIHGQTLSGQVFDLQANRGKPLLIHFWASWCGVCKLEQDSIEAISKDYSVIGIAMKSGSTEEVQHYMNSNRLSFAVINDPTGELAERYGVRAVPSSFIINPAGEIAFRETGYTTAWGLRLRLWLAQ